LSNALNIPPTKAEIQMFKSAILMQDKLEVSTLTLSPQDVEVTPKGLKEFWEKHKNDYMSTKSYKISYINVLPTQTDVKEEELQKYFTEHKDKYKDDEGKLLDFESARTQATQDFILKKLKREALLKFVDFRDGKTKSQGSRTVLITDKNFPVAKLQTASSGDVLKPIEYNNGYIIVKIDSVNMPKPKTFEEAKLLASKDFYQEKYSEKLEEVAKARLSTFQGEDIGFVSRDSIQKILGLDEANSMDFINYIFTQKSKQGYKIVGQKALLYRVLEQKLLPNVQMDKYASLLKQNVLKLKNAELNQNLIKQLSGRYESEQYYKGN
jgi:peptidyl-prolyl cis-trans isomerase D